MTPDNYDDLREFLKSGNYMVKVFDQSVSLEAQQEYFDLSMRVKMNLIKDKDYLSEAEKVFDPQVSINEKKEILTTFASIEKVEYYHFLENFEKQAPEELKEWAILALYESRARLEAELLELNAVFITSGLGGKNDSLRYFVVLFNDQNKPFSSVQFELVRKEFEFTFKQFNGEVSEITLDGNFIKIVCLLPFVVDIRECVAKAINECNSLGKFIREKYILTNAKYLSNDEIEHSLNSDFKHF